MQTPPTPSPEDTPAAPRRGAIVAAALLENVPELLILVGLVLLGVGAGVRWGLGEGLLAPGVILVAIGVWRMRAWDS